MDAADVRPKFWTYKFLSLPSPSCRTFKSREEHAPIDAIERNHQPARGSLQGGHRKDVGAPGGQVDIEAIRRELRSRPVVAGVAALLMSPSANCAARCRAAGAQSGLGYIIVYSEQFAYLDRMFFVALLFILYASISYAIFNNISLRLLRWAPRAGRDVLAEQRELKMLYPDQQLGLGRAKICKSKFWRGVR
jgi:hypothetical protein